MFNLLAIVTVPADRRQKTGFVYGLIYQYISCFISQQKIYRFVFVLTSYITFSDLPIMRKASLQRFLEKRKDR